MSTDSEIVEQAIDILSREGAWCKNAMWRDAEGNRTDWRRDGKAQTANHVASHCMMGAIYTAAGYWNGAGTWSPSQVHRIQLALCKTVGSVAKFNDNPSTTQEDVVLALKKVLEEL